MRITADWLQIADQGVNALLLVVPIEAGDTVDPVTVVNETQHPWVARDEVVREKVVLGAPLLAVSLFNELACKNNPQLLSQAWVDADLVLAIRYITAQTDAAVASRQASYTMRCVRSSLTLLGRHSNLASRERNKVRIKQIQDINVVPTLEVLKDVAIFGGLSVSLAMQDVIATPS